MEVMINDVKKWKCQFQQDPNKPTSLNDHTFQSYQTAWHKSIERAKALEEVVADMCESCGKIEQSYQVVLRSHHLLQITMRGDEFVPSYEYLQPLEEMHTQLKEEIHKIQEPTLEILVDTLHQHSSERNFFLLFHMHVHRTHKSKPNLSHVYVSHSRTSFVFHYSLGPAYIIVPPWSFFFPPLLAIAYLGLNIFCLKFPAPLPQ